MKLDEKALQLKHDKKYKSQFGCDAKWVGRMLGEIITDMVEKNIKVTPELLELQQFLRVKGNTRISNRNRSLWKNKNEEVKWIGE